MVPGTIHVTSVALGLGVALLCRNLRALTHLSIRSCRLGTSGLPTAYPFCHPVHSEGFSTAESGRIFRPLRSYEQLSGAPPKHYT
ncbi:hypothetical protein DFH94DRAFT_87028 [Russula ochroleuca]|jgi:hypothetical protein|uniref:Uncharacterized protein n=1 Tax=Russula ochroleuca TaxID=152965 RepID=A0A9P5T6V4_9AGAM|nr:hypothetical protein DFH94DRAFT_87028 [Russula ochroleuca]